MKICVVSTPIFALGQGGLVGYGGLEQIAWQQAKGLANKGHQVALVAPDGSYCPGVQIISIGPAGQVDEKMAYGGYKEARQGDQLLRRSHAGYWQVLRDCDVVIDHSWHKFSYGLKMEGQLQAPVLGWMHAPVDTMYKTLPPGVEKPCFVCISDDQRSHFEALFSRPARTCYNGIDLDFYKPLGMPRTKRFLFLARFSTVKGPDLAIEACRKADVGLDLVGDTKLTGEAEYLQSILHLADEANVVRHPSRMSAAALEAGAVEEDRQQIRFVGPATRGECVYWYSQAHVMLHPNQRFREPFGLAPVESMLCGCPVITWDYGAMRETIKTSPVKESTGILVDSLDGLVQAVKFASCNEAYWRGEITLADMRKNCRDWAAQFSEQRMVDRVESLAKEALDTGGW